MRLALSLALIVVTTATAEAAKSTRFWNLTANTVTRFELAPTGTDRWGKNQAENDKDGSVDHDERLKITETPTGTYDARLTDAKGRTCIIKAVAVKEGDVFTIEEKQMDGCSK